MDCHSAVSFRSIPQNAATRYYMEPRTTAQTQKNRANSKKELGDDPMVPSDWNKVANAGQETPIKIDS